MNLSLNDALNKLPFLRFALPLIVLVLGLRLGRFIFIGFRLKKRAELLNVLESEARDFWEDLGKPSFTIWQQLFRRRDPFANDRLWFYALWRADIFPDQPRVQAALVAYRRVEIVGLAYTGLMLIAAILFFVFMHK